VGGGGQHKQEGTREHVTCKESGMGLTEVARHRRGGGAAATQWVSDGDDAFLRPTTTRPGSWLPEREREHDEVRPFWLGEGEQRSSPKRWGGGGFSAISDEGRQTPMLGSGHLAAYERGGGVGCVGAGRLMQRKEIGERGARRLLHRSGGKTEAGPGASTRRREKDVGGGGSAQGHHVERRMEEGGVQSSSRACDRWGRAAVCPAWQRGSRGEGGSGRGSHGWAVAMGRSKRTTPFCN
jgi:hypothetical protein